MESIFIEAAFQRYFSSTERRSFRSLVECFGLSLQGLKERSMVVQKVFKTAGEPPLDVHFKLYTYKKSLWQGLFRRPRSKREVEHLKLFDACGISVPRVVGWGQMRRGWVKLDYEFLITVTIPGAIPLRAFVQQCALDAQLRGDIIRRLAKDVCAIHARHFFHQDLKWRNLLVVPKSKGQPDVYWIDCPNGYRDWSGLRRRHGRIKDLATLDKVAKDLCSLKERLRFVQCYLGLPPGDRAIRKWARAVEHYRKRRQDD